MTHVIVTAYHSFFIFRVTKKKCEYVLVQFWEFFFFFFFFFRNQEILWVFFMRFGPRRSFLSHKINFVTLCFRPYLPKQNFFLRNQEILCFLCVLDPGDHFTKSRRVSGVRQTKLGRGKFQFQIISKPFDRFPSYLV